MWQCPKCHEESEETFDVCWCCGTSRDGVEDLQFKPVVDQPELSEGLSNSTTIRGLKAGAGIAVLMAFLHPVIMLSVSYLADPAVIGFSAFRLIFAFAIGWAPFAAVGGAIAGAIGAQKYPESRALAAGVLSCLLFHVLFLIVLTNAFYRWPSVVVLLTLSIAALTGAIASSVGLIVGKRHVPEHV